MKRFLPLIGLLSASAIFAQPPASSPKAMGMDPATGNIVPPTVNGHPPNYTVAPTINGAAIGGTSASDTAFASSWNGVTTIAPSKNAVYDWAHTFDTNDNGKVNVLDLAAGIPKTDASGVLSLAVAGTDYLAAVSVGNMLFVDAVNGNNSTGTRGRADKPFLTLTAAKTAATSGDTIHVGPGTYAERNLLKNGVNWYFEDGAKVFITTSTTSAGAFTPNGAAIFDDSALGANGPVTCIIDGLGEFKRTESGASVAEATIFIHNASSNVTLRCKTVGGGGTIYYTLWQDGGRFSLHALTLSMDSTGFNTVFWSNGDLFLDCEEIGTSGNGAAIVSNTAVGATWSTGSMWITADRIYSDTNALQTIVTDGTVEARLWINAKKITSIASAAAISGNRVYIIAEKIDGQGGVAVAAPGELWLTAQKLETTDGTPIEISGGKCNITLQTLQSAATGNLITSAGGAATIEVQEATTAGSDMGGVQHTGGTLRLLNTKIDASAGDGANPITVFAAGLTLQNCALVAHLDRDSITASSARNVKVYGVSVANKAKHANITIQVGTLTVDTNVN